MPIGIVLRWALFAGYAAFFFVAPLWLLFDGRGLLVGAICAAGFLLAVRFRGNERIATRLNVKPMGSGDAGHVQSIVVEYCRRLMLPPPRLGVIEHPAVNMALFGFSRHGAHLVLTRGLLDRLDREELSAMIGRELCYLWHGDVVLESWLAQFLSLFGADQSTRREVSFRLFLRQVFFYPLTLIPVFLLRRSRPQSQLDLKSVKVTNRPQALAEGLRVLEALEQRIPLPAPFSTRHLFFVTPPSLDPFARAFFARENIAERIRAVERLAKAATV